MQSNDDNETLCPIRLVLYSIDGFANFMLVHRLHNFVNVISNSKVYMYAFQNFKILTTFWNFLPYVDVKNIIMYNAIGTYVVHTETCTHVEKCNNF